MIFLIRDCVYAAKMVLRLQPMSLELWFWKESSWGWFFLFFPMNFSSWFASYLEEQQNSEKLLFLKLWSPLCFLYLLLYILFCAFLIISPSYIQICRTFREKGIPCDAIWMDIDYMDGFRCFTFDKACSFLMIFLDDMCIAPLIYL